MLQLTVWSLPPILAAVVSIALFIRATTHRATPGVQGLLVLLTATAGWGLADAVSITATDPLIKTWAAKFSFASMTVAPLAWFVFCTGYAKRQPRVSNLLLWSITCVPAAIVAMAFTNEAHNLVWSSQQMINEGGASLLALEPGPLFYAMFGYGCVWLIAGSSIFGYAFSINRSDWKPIAAVVCTPLIAATAILFTISPWNPSTALNLTALGVAVSAWVLYQGIIGFGLLDNIPVVRDRVVDQLSDPVVVVSYKGSIVDANGAAAEMFGQSLSDIRGLGIAQFIPNWPKEDLERDGAAADEISIGGQIYDVAFSCLEQDPRHSDVVLLFRDVTVRHEDERRLRKMQKELERLAHTDALTGLYNRRIFMQRLNEEIERVRRHRSGMSVLIFDLDHFKRVNDTFGHDMGDVVLQTVAKIADQVKRTSDVAARLGGEEFALLLPETDQQGAVQLAQRLRKAIEGHSFVSPGGAPVEVTASLGVATTTVDKVASENLLNKADRALYRAKNNGRNRVCSTTI